MLHRAPALEALTSAEVGKIISQAVGEAQARSKPAVISVVDRVGNVLAVFRMNGAPANADGQDRPPACGTDLEGPGRQQRANAADRRDQQGDDRGLSVERRQCLLHTHRLASSSRNIIPPATLDAGLESGPLFGVQFSQLPCSDFSTRYSAGGGAAALIGPKRSPLGLAADPGSVPLYKNGVLVGGIGVMARRRLRLRSLHPVRRPGQ